MKEEIRKLLKQKYPEIDFDVSYPPEGFGDYSTNLSFALAKYRNTDISIVAEEVVEKLKTQFPHEFEKIETAKNGFVNLYLSKYYLMEQLKKINSNEKYGFNETMKGKTVVIEYTDPNPFKLFHIGHLMSNTIGEAVARFYEASGAKVLRVNYQGDVGLHVAKAVWAIINELKISFPDESEPIEDKIKYLGQAYALGSRAYETNEAKEAVEEINKKIYDRSDEEINRVYNLGKKWSLEYFEMIYKRLGTKFDHYFFESEAGEDGLKVVQKNKNIFIESEGAIIFKGENYGLHNRVFINSQGLPTYEAKELGLNKKKFELYSPDLSIIVTGNEINEYFKVLLKVMGLTMPEVAQKTIHIGHGMIRFKTGKISSRTGEVITADWLIEQVKDKLPESPPEVKEKIAVGAIKYSVLKQSPGRDIIFDFDKSISVKGDAAPYLEYTYARLAGIKKKASETSELFNFETLDKETELSLMKKIIKFPEAVVMAAQSNLPNILTLYLYELANLANSFYESSPVIQEKDEKVRSARLALVDLTASVLKKGLGLLGIEAPERI